MSRRDFVIAVVSGVAAVAHGGADAAQGKPALTAHSINEYIATAQREDEPTQLLLAAEVKRDVLAFLDQRFSLTPAQRRALTALSEEDRRRISVGVETALRRHYRLLFRSAAVPARVRVVDSTPASATGPMTLSISDDSTSASPSGVSGEVVLSWPCPTSRGRG